ncbi:hypothetical protein BDP81DRAFT_422582 [Colletotrichum phormii]|uniref:Uncharacterized protein n=1 Tax=Colletotrichum phormii TaxID=359342 RepID=A0AAI9ZV54_9PEZI|nr:uncharacterized protein BDP81DRAFT_422582 [Colletotrichum phormii]KAK1638746.1 hypothetical protein BDP81DRAFT_422582 [Colletotrichum phormii]
MRHPTKETTLNSLIYFSRMTNSLGCHPHRLMALATQSETRHSAITAPFSLPCETTWRNSAL